MADIDIDPFGEHESRTEEPTDENIPLTPVTPGGGPTWEPEHEQETSFGSPEVPLSRGEILHKEYLVGEIYELIGNKTHQRLEPNLRLFELDKDGRLYFKGKPLTRVLHGLVPLINMQNYIFKHFMKTVEPTFLKFCTIIELITLHLEYTIAQVKYANFSYAHAQTFVLLNKEMEKFLLASES